MLGFVLGLLLLLVLVSFLFFYLFTIRRKRRDRIEWLLNELQKESVSASIDLFYEYANQKGVTDFPGCFVAYNSKTRKYYVNYSQTILASAISYLSKHNCSRIRLVPRIGESKSDAVLFDMANLLKRRYAKDREGAVQRAKRKKEELAAKQQAELDWLAEEQKRKQEEKAYKRKYLAQRKAQKIEEEKRLAEARRLVEEQYQAELEQQYLFEKQVELEAQETERRKSELERQEYVSGYWDEWQRQVEQEEREKEQEQELLAQQQLLQEQLLADQRAREQAIREYKRAYVCKKQAQTHLNEYEDSALVFTPDTFHNVREDYKNDKNKRISDLSFSGCYILKNKSKNGKCYVGKSQDVMDRVRQHLTINGSKELFADYYYNGDDIEIVMIALNDTAYESIGDLETDLINKYKATTDGYNKQGGNDRFKDIDVIKNIA